MRRGRELTWISWLVAIATIVVMSTAGGDLRGLAAPGLPPTTSAGPQQSARPHVIVIVMENHGYGDLVGAAAATWINQAAAKYGVAERSYGVAHPSQPNYIALTSGSTQGVVDDGDVTIDVPNLAEQVESSGRTWTAYMQSLATCNGAVLRSFCGGQLYARKHDPFVSYQRIVSDPTRVARIVDLSQLEIDLAAGSAADLVWITPDQCHDMHGIVGRSGVPCSGFDDPQLVAAGDAFLGDTVGSIMASTSWAPGSVLLVTWDEAGGQDSSSCCTAEPGGGHILTLVIPYRGEPRRSDVPYDHYSVLSTIEALLGLPCLGQACFVSPMMDLIRPAEGPADLPSPRTDIGLGPSGRRPGERISPMNTDHFDGMTVAQAHG